MLYLWLYTGTVSLSLARWLVLHCQHRLLLVVRRYLRRLRSDFPVTSLTLSDRYLSGTLPQELSNLRSLKTLLLQGNAFSGAVPLLSNIASLTEIYLDNNRFTVFPDGFFRGLTGLYVFSISHNPFLSPWTIPPDLAEAAGMTRFLASSANLIGSIPAVFASLQSLSELRLSNNNLTGYIDALASMSSLTQVWLQNNAFTGPIPDLSECASLSDLQLKDNSFTGIVPDSLVNLASLRNVSLSNNKFQGRRPEFPFTHVDDDGANRYCLETPGAPCDPQVTALIDVASAFAYPAKLTEGWEGNDACAGWVFVECDSMKSVTVLNFGKQHLGGYISPSIAKLTSLKELYLNDNNLTGTIPHKLAALKSLRIVDLSNNNLAGKIPSFPISVKFFFDGNPFLGTNAGVAGSAANSNGGISRAMKGVAITLGALVPVLVFAVAYILCGRKSTIHNDRNQQRERNSGGFSAEKLRQATDNFNEKNILGKGGFGVVYKGEMEGGTKIAVKKMEGTEMGNGEFQAEIDALTKVRHRNLVALHGYCINGGDKMLVYEYMPQGTLAQHLFEERNLTWKQRMAIALDVARGVEYLHSLGPQTFIHRDLKPRNILLGNDMRAKVADFGLAKAVTDGSKSMETRVAGTRGYLAPEYAATRRVSVKVDVYAFGVILMEIITGRKALQSPVGGEGADIEALFRRDSIAREDVETMADPVIMRDEETLRSLLKVAKLAKRCASKKPKERPRMAEVVNVLAPLVERWDPATQSTLYFSDNYVSFEQVLTS